MTIREHFESTGNWLFRRRGSLPVIALSPFLLVALQQAEYFERVWGDDFQTVWEITCITISCLGLAIRCITLGWIHEGTSGRNTKEQLADQLNTDGMYSVMRHPLSAGNFLIILGFALFVQVGWFVMITVLLFGIFYERIVFAEEEFLLRKFGNAYVRWAKAIPAFIPGFRAWQKPDREFSFRRVLKREYSTFLGIIAGFIILKILANFLGEQEIEFKPLWLLPLLIGGGVYLLLRYLRKKTDFLQTTPSCVPRKYP